jgi:hypothetical protein
VKERKAVETKRWETEDKKAGLEKEIERLNEDYKKILEKEGTLKGRIEEICEILGLNFKEEMRKIEEKTEMVEEEPEVAEEVEVEEAKEEIPEVIEEKPETGAKEEGAKEERPEVKEKPEEVEEIKPEIKEEVPRVEEKAVTTPEELRYWKREEIRTMEKDLRRLREESIEKRGFELGEERKVSPPPVLEEKPKEEEFPRIEPEIKIEKLPERPPKILGILARVLISVFLLFTLISFGFFISKRFQKKPPVKITPPPTEVEKEVPKEEKTEVQKPKIVVPPSLILVEEEREVEIKKNEEIEKRVLEEMKKEIKEGEMVRIVIKNLAENRLVSLEEILDSFQIWKPEKILEKVENFTLAIYSQKEGKRIILVAKIKKGEKLDEIKSWEEKIEKEGVFVSGKKIQTISKRFKEILVKGEKVRCLTVSKEDFGICHSLINDYFIFSQSLEGMGKVIDKIKK